MGQNFLYLISVFKCQGTFSEAVQRINWHYHILHFSSISAQYRALCTSVISYFSMWNNTGYTNYCLKWSLVLKKTEKSIPSSEGFMVNMVSSDDGQFWGFYTNQCTWFVSLFQRNMLPPSSELIRFRWMLK